MRLVIWVRGLFGLSLFLASANIFAGENVWTTDGPPGAVSALAIDPTTLTLYAVTRTAPDRDGVFKRSDTAGTWDLLAEAPPFRLISTVAVDPSDSNVYASINAGPFGGAFYRSTDNGITWVLVASSQQQNFWYFAFPADESETLYAGGSSCYCTGFPCFFRTLCSASVFESTDSGVTWRALGGLLAGGRVSSVAFDPFARNRIYAAGDGGVFVTLDRGAHWSSPTAGGEGCQSITVAVDPRDGNVVFAATRFGRASYCGGLYRSEDGGRAWIRTLIETFDVTSIQIDPQSPEIVYTAAAIRDANGERSGVLRSTDGGGTWTQLGSNLPDVVSLVLEPSGHVLHAATSTGVFDYEIVPGARPPVIPPRTRETRVLAPRP